MFLKRLELQGFKSFADKTIINFENGITGVVGPNGSGKSNIADSIKWVLGEQSVKTLRGSKMEDVIFSGTSKRKPIGYAEVTLVLDNNDKKIPIDYLEVSITRRVFRSGESEYYINKTSCRLKDIKELFMDTGVGTDGYSIIGQGKIDEILSTKSEDRRNLFEEAAGIVKYKSRKIQSEKKLEKVKNNLLRIADITHELENQLEPLKKQSEDAKQYINLSKNLEELEVNLFIREIDRLKEQNMYLENQKESVNNQLQIKENGKNNLEKEFNEIKEQIQKIDENIEDAQDNKYNIQNNIEKNEGELKLSSERVIFLNKEKNRLFSDIKDLNEKILDIDKSNEQLQDKRVDIQEKINHFSNELINKTENNNKILKRLKDEEENIEKKKSDIVDFLNTIADKKGKIKTIKSFNDSIENRIHQINEELQELSYQSKKNNIEVEKIQKNILMKEKELHNLKNDIDITTQNKKDMQESYNNLLIELNDIKGEMRSKISKLNLLKEMKSEYEGFYKSVKNTLLACEKHEFLSREIRGVVAELIKVDKKYEKAIEIALGSSLQNIITDTEHGAKNIIQYLKKNKLGRVTFLPISTVLGRGLYGKEKSLVNEKGLVGIASELVDFEKDYKGIINYLLGRVLIVKNIDDGITIARKCNHSLKIVSLDGETINPGGSMTGGSYKTNRTTLLGRERQIYELEKEIKNIEQKYNTINNNLNSLKDKILEMEVEVKCYVNKFNKVNDESKILIDELRNKKEEERKLEYDIHKTEKEKKRLLFENKNSNQDIKELEKDMEELTKINHSTNKDVENKIRQYENIKHKKEVLDNDIIEIKLKIASFKQELKSIKGSIFDVDQNKSNIIISLNNKKVEYKKTEEKIKILEDKHNNYKKRKTELFSEFNNYEDKLLKLKHNKSNIMKKFYDEQENLKKINEEINNLQKSINTLELKLTKNEMTIEKYNDKLWEDYEMSYKMALNYKKDIENVSKVEGKIKQIKEKIKQIGNINVNSIEEYKKVKERYEFLLEQKSDLIKGENSLNKVIIDMEINMREQFAKNFKLIKKYFGEVFQKLFQGGKADVYLSDENDILGSGIEIIAQPPGKRLQNISLLSGGEKALTAIALLFAILKLKPTPFCILDEIEAALDDANVYRFSDYLKQYSKNTQFIVITHRKGTMESMDCLYGVTMQEKGVSKLVSVKLTDKISEKAS